MASKFTAPSQSIWKEVFQNTRAEDIQNANRKIIKTHFHEDVRSLLEKLAQDRVLSAVVMDDNEVVMGFIDVLDILACVLEVTANSEDITKERIANIKWEGQCFIRQNAGVLSNFSEGNPFHRVTKRTSVLDIMRIFARGVHRVAIMEGSAFVNVISQSDIIRFLSMKGKLFGDNMKMSLDLIGLSFLGVCTVSQDLNTLKALSIMRKLRVSGIGIVDHEGKLTGNLSASDLMGLKENNFHLLTSPILIFLEKIHHEIKAPVFVFPSESMQSLLLKFVIHNVHRVYIVDQKMIPIGVVTMTDIIKWWTE